MTLGREFVRELLEVLPPGVRTAALAVVRRYSGERLYLPAGRAEERRNAALAMLQGGMRREQVQDALRARFDVGEDCARRDVRLALNRRKSRKFGGEIARPGVAELATSQPMDRDP